MIPSLPSRLCHSPKHLLDFRFHSFMVEYFTIILQAEGGERE